jgi:hypothetical protein
MATNRPTVDNDGSPRLYKKLRIDYHSSLEYALIMSSSLRKILRSVLRQLGPDEEPEEVAGSCAVIGSVISDCKHRRMYIQ